MMSSRSIYLLAALIGGAVLPVQIALNALYDRVDDCLSILKHYLLDRSHIIGHSLGTIIAQLFAIK